MSSLTVFGFFALAKGHRDLFQKPGSSTKTYYCFYTTALQCSSGVVLPAELRIYSPFNDTVLQDHTVVFTISRAYFPSHGTILLDASHLFPFPGDPSEEDAYDRNLPDCRIPFVIGLGSVPFRHEMLSDGVSKAFNVVCSEFVRDGSKTSTVQCVTYHFIFVPCPHVVLDVFMTVLVHDGTTHLLHIPILLSNSLGPLQASRRPELSELMSKALCLMSVQLKTQI